MKEIVLYKEDEWYELKILPEQPYIKLNEVFFEPKILDELNKFNYIFHFDIEYDRNSKKGNHSGTFGFSPNFHQGIYFIDQELNVKQAKKVKIKFKPHNEVVEKIQLRIKYDSIKRLDISNPKIEFDKHLTRTENTKILFSAPYGQGKTTFLNYYFEENKNEYEVFRVFPVNYSVASNEDIFRYIKTDILYQLIVEKNTEFDKVDAEYAKSAPKFIKDNIHKILAPFLLLIPSVGKNIYTMFEKLDALKDEFFKYHDEQNVDGLKIANNYIEDYIEKEGSIYEDNFVTHIIRQQVAKIEEQTSKKTVLIIDDLDRMDPEHMFRILNVISAHYDSSQQNLIFETNKFGFDKIILVCDFNNIKHIFQHRYGKKVDFGGYINKFYSTHPFSYNNKEMMYSIIPELDDINGRIKTPILPALKYIFNALIENDKISLRDIIHLKEIGISSLVNETRTKLLNNTNQFFAYGTYTPIIALLNKIANREMLIDMFTVCKQNNTDLRKFNTFPFWQLISPIGEKKRIEDQRYSYSTSKYKISYIPFLDEYDFVNMRNDLIIHDLNGNKIDEKDVVFENEDFYDLIIESINKYFKLTNA